MTIFRELQSATVNGYGEVDDYGQPTQGATREIEIAFKPYSQQNVMDPRYVDVEAVGLTRDFIAPGEVLHLAQGDFQVKYVIPASRWQEALLVKL